MLRNWRMLTLLFLLLGPLVAYVVLGFLWLKEHAGPIGFRGELVLYATVFWVLTYALFSYLASLWTRSNQKLLPPLDWDSPGTFTGRDRDAWELVQRHAELGEQLPLESLSGFDVYVDSGRALARELAHQYRPESKDPIEHVPIVDMLTALQLAAEDLTHLIREVPAGDIVTPGHWKHAVRAAGYLQRANEIYTVLLPMFQPAAGLMRLGTQKLMVQPAWKNMQQNLMRWFFRAYINRLGTHLIELYSGRLAIGAEQYRRMNRRWTGKPAASPDHASQLTIGIAGTEALRRTSLVKAIDSARIQHMDSVRAQLREAGFDPALAIAMREADLREIALSPFRTGQESRRDRGLRVQAVRAATEADLLVILIDAGCDDHSSEARFLDELSEWYAERPELVMPPVLAVLAGIDRAEAPGSWSPPIDWQDGNRPRDAWIRSTLTSVRTEFGSRVADVVPIGLDSPQTEGISERLLPGLATLLHRAERSALLRHLDTLARRSKLGRVLGQVRRQGRRLWAGGRMV